MFSKTMSRVLAFFLIFTFGLTSLQAGTVYFNDQPGSSFAFRNMSETGASVPPSLLQEPVLSTAPVDTIKFNPSAFVVVENNGPSTDSSVLSSQLFVSLQSLQLSLDELTISVAGTWASTLYRPAGQADVGLSVNLDLVFNNVTKNLTVEVAKDLVNKTWAGSLTVTQQFLKDNFIVPAQGIQQLGVTVTSTVNATATYANARSGITYLDLSVKAVPEPASSSLVLIGAAMLGLARTFRRRSR